MMISCAGFAHRHRNIVRYHQVTGHMFAYPIVHDLVKNDTVEAEALYVPGPALMCGCV